MLFRADRALSEGSGPMPGAVLDRTIWAGVVVTERGSRYPAKATRPARGNSRCSSPSPPDDPASEPNLTAWTMLRRFDKPFLTAFSDSHPVTAAAET